MSFILHTNHTFLLVSQNNKYGLFCQLFTANGVTRPLSLQPTATSYYSATLDADGNPHIVCLPTSYKLTYFYYENSHFLKKNLVELPSDTTTLSWPLIHFLGGTIHLFYLTYKASSHMYAFLHTQLDSNKTEILFETSSMPQLFKSSSSDDKIYIFYVLSQPTPCIRCLEFGPSGLNQQNLLTCATPLVDYSFCFYEGDLHLCYVTEENSQYALYYTEPAQEVLTLISTTVSSPMPTLFGYYHQLWLNTLNANKLHVQLSVDGGQSFSVTVPSSLQGSTSRYIFISSEKFMLDVYEVYASIQNTIRISTLAALDIEHIHYDTELPIELELLLEGLRLSSSSCSQANSLALENAQLKGTLANLEAKLARPSEPPRPSTTVHSATAAFMKEMPQWDVPPLI